MNKINPESDMNFFLPIEFEKGKNKKTGEKIMKIKGIASTADQDSEGEVLEPVGFDLSRFLETGFLNWNHQAKGTGGKGGAEAIIGEPTLAKVTPKGELYVEGLLYNGHPLAESVWNLAETLERNKSKRKLGFSIEGRALERDTINPKRITKALLTGLAVTHVPVNTNTYLDLVKGTQKEDFAPYEDEEFLIKSEDTKYIYEFSCDGKKFGITKSFEVEEIQDKSMTTENTSALVPESLDGKKKNLAPEIKKAVMLGIIPIEDILEKAKYIKREGTRGNYKYIYEEPSKNVGEGKSKKAGFNLKPGFEGDFKNNEGEDLFVRVYKDGGVKVEGSNVREDFKTTEEAEGYLNKIGAKKTS